MAEHESPVLAAGARLVSAVCATEVVVVRVADPSVVIECGGSRMLPAGTRTAAAGTPQPGLDGGSLIGKRYGGPESPVELLCVKAGAGTLCAGGAVLEQRSAKPLPASD